MKLDKKKLGIKSQKNMSTKKIKSKYLQTAIDS